MTHHKKSNKEDIKKKLLLKRKERKQKIQKKKARLVIHNLPFAVTEENLLEHFGKYGDIEEVLLLKKEDGQKVGCAFVQFKLVQKASKAKHHLNNQPFMGRNISVDFAMSKKDYIKTKPVKIEPDIQIKEEPLDTKEDLKETIKEENIGETSKKEIITDEEIEEEDEFDSETEDKFYVDNKKPLMSYNKKVKTNNSEDISEGKTVFVKNVPFSATNKDLLDCMKKYGPVTYALICIDKETEYSKGTGFVKFVNKEDAQKVLEAGTELKLLDNILDCVPALNKNDIQNKDAEKQQEKIKNKNKDSRNLYLVKEGVIMAGSKAAEGVSPSDMAKRLQLEQYKTQMLKNLNMFVSNQRLVIHNLPPNWDDKKLRQLCSKFSGKGARIQEARIMRDMRNLNAAGVGKSKEFAFVTLNTHENALTLLRNLNNNPNIFTKARRPIVAFSIEKKTAVKAKLKRMQVSRLKNPLSKDYDPNLKNSEKTTENSKDTSTNEFSGVAAKPGVVQKMRNRYKLTNQAKIHYENVKKEKRKKKTLKRSLDANKKDFIKQEKQKQNHKNLQRDNLSVIESEYKKEKYSGPKVKKAKWYT